MSHPSTQHHLISLAQKSVAILCLLALFDGPLLGLQTYAWIKMVWDRSEEMGVSRAIINVAEGQDPCELCQFISEESASDTDAGFTPIQGSKRQPKLLSDQIAIRPSSLLGHLTFFDIAQNGTHLDEPPPNPPPRGILGV